MYTFPDNFTENFMAFIATNFIEQPKPKPIEAGSLQLSPITLNEDYRKEWNINQSDFVVLTRDGERINDSLYRVGGMGNKPDGKNYFMLLKQVEAYYDLAWLKKNGLKPDPKYLESRWCILDKDGIEKVEFDRFRSPYIVKGSCIYSIDQNYYNIETGEHYCKSYTHMSSTKYLFLENAYDKDESKRGVLKIDKLTGTYELFQGE